MGGGIRLNIPPNNLRVNIDQGLVKRVAFIDLKKAIETIDLDDLTLETLDL